MKLQESMSLAGAKPQACLSTLLARAIAAWNAYWFRSYGGYSLAAARIGCGIACLLAMHMYVLPDYKLYFAIQDLEAYHPTSLLRLWPTLPSATHCEALKIIAILSAVTLTVGLYARLSLWVCFLSNLVLADIVHGLNGGESIALNFVFLTQIGLLFGDVGCEWSLDACFRRRRANEFGNISQTRWPVYLVQLLLTLVFFNGFWHKWRAGGFGLDWALTDSLRHWLVWRYDMWDEPRTVLADWALQECWRYRLAALMNLTSQCLSILACVSVHRPRLRLLFGGFFLLETLGLGLFMGFWCLHWLPLLVIFVDWEAVVDWCASRHLAQPARRAALVPARLCGLVSAYILSIGASYCLVAFCFLHHGVYPLVGATPFMALKVKEPRKDHLSYEDLYHRIEIDDQPLARSRFTAWLYYNHRDWQFTTDVGRIQRSLGVVQRAHSCDDGAVIWEIGGMAKWANWDPRQRRRIARSWARHSQRLAASGEIHGTHSVTLKAVLFRVPAYPEEAKAQPILQGLRARLDADGTFKMVAAVQELGASPKLGKVRILQRGLRRPAYRLGVFHVDDDTEIPLAGSWDGDCFTYTRSPASVGQLVIHVNDPALYDTDTVFIGPSMW